jgi:hypothetical protein
MSFHGSRVAVHFSYECRDDKGQWSQSYGNENWEFNDEGKCGGGLPASMICHSKNGIADFDGPNDRGLQIVPASPNLASRNSRNTHGPQIYGDCFYAPR